MQALGKNLFLLILFSASSALAQLVPLAATDTASQFRSIYNSNLTLIAAGVTPSDGQFIFDSEDKLIATEKQIIVTNNANGTVFSVDREGRVVLEGNLTVGTTEGISASTTQSQGQGLLESTGINEVSVVANANDVVTLPGATGGRSILVINNGANVLQVFPLFGDDLGAGTNLSDTIAAGTSQRFTAWDSNNWVQE